MVDAVVSYAVERLGSFLIEKTIFLRGVDNEVEWLKDELGLMQRFLRDAEEKQHGDDLIGKWLFDIRELAYDIEDLLDTFNLKVHIQADDGDGATMEGKQKSGCFPPVFCCIFDKGKEQFNRYNIGKEIEDFKTRINDLTLRRQRYQLQDSSNNNTGEGRRNALGRLGELRRSTSFAVEENVIGFEDDAHKLLAKLCDDDPPRLVISIHGMGGLGKTTLAKKLYHHCDVKKKFLDYRAWVFVSQDYTIRDLLVRIIKSFVFGDIKTEDLEKMNEEDLERYLHKSLQGHCYLVVIDDVWNKEAWKSIKGSFPDNKNGSRVIITTRSKEVAENSDERTYAYNLHYLKPNESWLLFCEKAFQNFSANEGLENLGREMVQKCNGLPLAIVVLSGLLSKKKPQEWRVVRDHLWQYLKADSIEIHSLLSLSFDSLPYQLKQCFLYLGLFPEDFEINMEKLIHLLVVEGFIPQVQDHIMEEVAKDYLDELINRSLIQVEKRYWRRIATCRVHDLLRDLAIEKAKSLNFLYIHDEAKHSDISPTISSCPRQVLYSGVERPLWLKKSNPRLRSLFLFDDCRQMVHMCRKFSSLRVLDSCVGVDYETKSMLKEEIGKLIHLKYLGLRETYFDLSSSSVFNLWRLQTLDVFGLDWPVNLPAEICKLQELRHLIGRFANSPLQIDSLTKLQTLKYVQHYYWSEIKTEKLVNLRELWIDYSDGVFTFDSISNLKSLRILSVDSSYAGTCFASLEPLSHCKHLVELRLRGKIEKLPEDIHQLLPNLECLSLRHSELKDDPMPVLEKLPYLTILHLGEAFYSGKKIMCSAKGFAWLEILLIDDLIEELQVEEGALPTLRGLRMADKHRLTIPERLRSIPTPDPREYTSMSPDTALRHY